MKILIIGDVIGKPGRQMVKKFLEKNKKNYSFIIVNGENLAGGFGITEKVAKELITEGVDLFTSGNHIWDKKDSYEFLNSSEKVIRPANYPDTVPGKGYIIKKTKCDNKILVINIQGRVFMNELESPFYEVKKILNEVPEEIKCIIVDFHAEASSEKMALGWFLDGKVSVVYGTHTHVQTADERVFTKGTGYITDIGMTGGFDGVIGMKKDDVINKFLNYLPARFNACNSNLRLNGIEVDLDEKNGKCNEIKRVNISVEDL